MSAELELVEPQLDELAQAEKVIADAREARLKRCFEAVNKVLEGHKCQLNVEVMIGQQSVPAHQILNLPTRVAITSKA